MDNLGLDNLTDDQLVELARAIATQIAKRNPAVADAAQAAIRDEIAKAAKSQDNLWAKKKWLATMVVEHVGANCELTVWRANDRDVTRVYLDLNGSDRKGRANIKWCLHVTGDSKHPPGTLTKDEGSSASTMASGRVVKIICQHAIAAFSSVRIDCDQAAGTKYDIPPMPADYVTAVAEIAAKRAAKSARDAHEAQARAQLFDQIEVAEKVALAEHKLSYTFQLPKDLADEFNARRKAARDELTAIMAVYDAEHGEPK